jgi:hypothetical protein
MAYKACKDRCQACGHSPGCKCWRGNTIVRLGSWRLCSECRRECRKEGVDSYCDVAAMVRVIQKRFGCKAKP